MSNRKGSGARKPANSKRQQVHKKAGFVDRLLTDDRLRGALWFSAAAFLVFYLGAMLIFRLVLVSADGSGYDSAVIAVFALIAAAVVGRKKYYDDDGV